MIAEDLLALGQPRRIVGLDPVREPLVELHPFGAGDRRVRRVPDEDVTEAVCALPGGRGALGVDQFLRHQGLERLLEVPGILVGAKRRHGTRPELLPDHRSPLDHRALR